MNIGREFESLLYIKVFIIGLLLKFLLTDQNKCIVIIEGEDGKTHINIYSKGETKLGRWLSNFSREPITINEDGSFCSIEGYWYWLLTGDDVLRTLHGYNAKKIGRAAKLRISRNDVDEQLFQSKILAAIDIKLKANKPMLLRLVKNTLPLCHYYVVSCGHRIDAKYEWIVEHISTRRKELLEYFHSKGLYTSILE